MLKDQLNISTTFEQVYSLIAGVTSDRPWMYSGPIIAWEIMLWKSNEKWYWYYSYDIYVHICCHIGYFLIIFRLFLDIKLLWQSKWLWRWNNDNTHQCAQPPTAIQNMRSIMLNIKQIVSRKEENGVYSSKRGLMEHVKRRKVGVYNIAPRGGGE